MKNFLILIFTIFFSSIAHAGLNEVGSGGFYQEDCKETILGDYKRSYEQAKSEGRDFIMYVSISEDGCSSGASMPMYGINKKGHKSAYKYCKKNAKKFTKADCFIFSINDEIVWKDYDQLSVSQKDLDRERQSKPVFLDEDKKPGRFFEDQPDITNDFQIHVIYTLYKDSKDKEGDINGKVERLIKVANDWTYKTTKKANEKSNTMNGEGQRMKLDYRKDGKLDISFIRLGVTKKEFRDCSGSCGNLAERTIINAGFNNPKKIYVNFGDYSYAEWPYSAGFPIFNIFSTASGSRLNKSEVGYFLLHEALHSMGGIYSCSPKHVNGHNTKKSSDMMSLQGDGRNMTLDPKNDDYWGHKNLSCPDLQDSVYFTPTSDTPFDPFEVTCLSKDKWKITKHDYKNFEDRRGIGYQCFYTRDDVTAPWEKEFGIY